MNEAAESLMDVMENLLLKFMENRQAPLRLMLAGLLVIGLAPRAGADTLTGNEAYGKTLVEEVAWEKDVTHATGESSLGGLSGSFASGEISQNPCPSAATAPAETAVQVNPDFVACDIGDPLNLSAASLGGDGLAGAFAFLLTTDSPQSPAGESTATSDSESFPISSSLWLLASVAAVLILIGSRIILRSRTVRRSHRR